MKRTLTLILTLLATICAVAALRLSHVNLENVRTLDVFGELSLQIPPGLHYAALSMGLLVMGGFLAGQDFAFGSHRHGHLEFLRAECEKLAIPLIVMPFVKAEGHKISSSLIRLALREGHVEKAAEMLANPAIRVSEAAYAAGFEDPNYFGKAFRRHFGCTPGRYRTRMPATKRR